MHGLRLVSEVDALHFKETVNIDLAVHLLDELASGHLIKVLLGWRQDLHRLGSVEHEVEVIDSQLATELALGRVLDAEIALLEMRWQLLPAQWRAQNLLRRLHHLIFIYGTAKRFLGCLHQVDLMPNPPAVQADWRRLLNHWQIQPAQVPLRIPMV